MISPSSLTQNIFKSKFVFYILFLFPLFLISASTSQNDLHSKGLAFPWVKAYNFPIEEIPIKSSQVNLQCLLIDTQKNLEQKTVYKHFAIKPLTKKGVEIISQIKIDFDPSFSQVVMHSIQIFREGKWFDRLENSRHNLFQRETELEQNIYNGDFTLAYLLNDIREGDILEYSYSVTGENPFFFFSL